MSRLSRNIIAFPSVVWNHNWERQHEIIYRLALETSASAYVHQPYGMINHSLKTILHKAGKIRAGNDPSVRFSNRTASNMKFVGGLFLPYHYFAPADQLNAWLIEKRTPVLYRESIVFATYLNAFTLKLFKKGHIRLLDLAQRRQKTNALSRAAKRIEKEAVKAADLITTDSIATKQDYEDIRPDIIHLPTGVNPGRFSSLSPVSEAAELKDKWPVIAGYVGTDLAVDKHTLEALITHFPRVLFLLVGNFDRPEILQLNKYSNVVMPGRKPSSEIPAWIAGFDIGLIPYSVNERNSGIFPTKLLEYLAAGIPVLSSALPDVMALANNAVKIYKPGTATPVFEQLLSEYPALKGDALEIASAHSWESTFEQYFSYLKKTGA